MADNLKPFGSPDGSRADLNEMQQDFISFGHNAAWSGISMKSDDRSVRVIVGRKGSGKTVYLRRLQADASRENSIFAHPPEFNSGLPSTESVIWISELFRNGPTLDEKWARIWYAAILRSLVSQLLHNNTLRAAASNSETEILQTEYSVLYRRFETPATVYSQVAEILTDQNLNTVHKMNAYLNHYLWAELEYRIQEILKTLPPVLLYLDAIDEQFEKAPVHWMKCQEGLFYQVMRFLRDSELGGRLHIVICVRDIVLASAYRGEHQTRYYNSPHIRVMNWDRQAIMFFLDEKISRLDDKYFLGDPLEGKTLHSWLGLTEIENTSRRLVEPIDQYLLRHTRMLPRDIVTLGNTLCEAIENSRYDRNPLEKQEVIRRAVAAAARRFGEEQLQICASQITIGFMPNDAVKMDYASAYVENPEYHRIVAEDLKAILQSCGSDALPKSYLSRIVRNANKRWKAESNVLSVLWQNGLLGYVNTRDRVDRHTFFTEQSGYDLPQWSDRFLLHSILIDAIGFRKVSPDPVINFS